MGISQCGAPVLRFGLERSPFLQLFDASHQPKLASADLQHPDRPVFVSVETTYRVRRSDSNERVYQLYELTWLWRTAELPHDAAFLDEDGRWRPVSELVEPILEAQKVREEASTSSARSPRPARWWWGLTLCGMLVVSGMAAPGIYRTCASWRAAKLQEREALEREQAARKQDFISSNLVIPGMTHDEVRRIVGQPREIKATGDGNLERWVYKTQTIVFENGKVIGVESAR